MFYPYIKHKCLLAYAFLFFTFFVFVKTLATEKNYNLEILTEVVSTPNLSLTDYLSPWISFTASSCIPGSVRTSNNTTISEYAVKFDGVDDYFIARDNTSLNSPLRRLDLVKNPTNGPFLLVGGRTSSEGQPWAVSTVFQYTSTAKKVTVWSQYDAGRKAKAALSVDNRKVNFYYGTNADYVQWTATADFPTGWYGVFVEYDGFGYAPGFYPNLGLGQFYTGFRIRYVNLLTGEVTEPDGVWDYSLDGYEAVLEGEFYVGAENPTTSLYDAMISSVAITTIGNNARYLTDPEISAFTIDPLKWLQNYKVGKDWRKPDVLDSSVSNFQMDTNNPSKGAYGTKVWLFGDGENDRVGAVLDTDPATATAIESQVEVDIASQDLVAKKTEADNIKWVTPIITSGEGGSFPENTTTTVYTVTGLSYADLGLSYSLGTSLDEHAFYINSVTGEIRFKNADYENPTDANKDNVYELEIIAVDAAGLYSCPTKIIEITVTNVDELVVDYDDIVKTYGDPNFKLKPKTINSSGTVTYSVVGVNTTGLKLQGPNNSRVNIGTIGVVTVRATIAQEGAVDGGTRDIKITVVQKALDVTVSNRTKEYGNPNVTFIYEADLVNGDAFRDVFDGDLVRDPGENIGTYPINIGTLALKNTGVALNYTFTYTPVDFEITKRKITVTPKANQSKIFGEADPTILFEYEPELIDPDIFTGNLSRKVGENVGDYEITSGDLALNANYELVVAQGVNFTILQKEIKITPTANQSKIYGDADPTEISYGFYPALEGTDSFIGKLSRVSGENVNDYAITLGDLKVNNNYKLNLIPEKFSIVQKNITVSPNTNQSKTYGDAEPILSYFLSTPLVAGDSFTGVLERESGEIVGVYKINQGSLNLSGNYNLSFTGGIEFEITKKEITVTPDSDQSRVYGDPELALFSYTISPALVSGDVFTGALQREPGDNVGLYEIKQGTLKLSDNYEFKFTEGVDFEITKKVIRIIPEDGQSKVYGDVDPNKLLYDFAPSLISGDFFSGKLSRMIGEDVADYAITLGSLNVSDNYELQLQGAGSFEIKQKEIVVTPNNNQSKIYGDLDPSTFSYTYVPALIPGDVFTGELARISGENAGEYEITQGDLGLSDNYKLNFATGVEFEIFKRPITVTPDSNQSKIYGETDEILNYTSSPALVDGDKFTGVLKRDSGESVGFYKIEQGNLELNSTNYELTFTRGVEFEITKKIITVTPNFNQSKIYGEADPNNLTYSLSTPLVNGDEFIGKLGRASGDNVGNYEINQGTLTLSNNYVLDFVNGINFEITKKTITIAPLNGQNKIYGENDPNILDYDYSPNLVDGDEFSGKLSRIEGENVGFYNIILGDLTINDNYKFDFDDTIEFQIQQKEIVITPKNNQSKIYGNAEITLEYEAPIGIVGTDSFIGKLERILGEDVGTYEITQGSLVLSNNYKINFTEGVEFEIFKRPITVTPDVNQSKIYGETDPVLSYVISSPLVGDDVFEGTLERRKGDNVGMYEIEQGSLKLSENYDLSFTKDIDFEIQQKAITVIPDSNQFIVYGDREEELTYKIIPDLIGDDRLSGNLTRQPGSDAGSYGIILGTIKDISGNYDLNFTDDVFFEIKPREITVIPEAGQTKVFGEADPDPIQYSLSKQLLNEDPIVGAISRIAGENTGDYPYELGSLDAGKNYKLTLAEGFLFKITPAEAVLNFTNITKTYGDDDFILEATSNIENANISYEIVGLNNGTELYGNNNGLVDIGNAGEVVIKATVEGNQNYLSVSKEIILTIDKAILYASTPDYSRVYLEDNPVFDIIYEGFVNQDTKNDIDELPEPYSNLTKDSPVTSEPIFIRGGQDDNYEIVPVGLNDLGILTITKRMPVIEFADSFKSYGEADFALGATTDSESRLTYAFVGDRRENDFAGVNQERFSIGTAGTYTVRASVAETTNFKSASVDALVTIEKAILTVTILDETKVYNTPNPTLTDNIQYEGFVNGEGPAVIDVLPELTTGVTQTTNVGTYSIFVLDSGSDDNYSIEIPQISALFRVTQATPTLSIEDVLKTYGDVDFDLDQAAKVSTSSDGNTIYEIEGGQGANSIRLSGANNKMVSLKGAGEVTIKATVSETQNYKSVSKEIVLTIEKAILFASTLDASRIYLDENPSFEIVYSGFVNGDTKADIDEEPVAYTSLTKDSNVTSDFIFIKGGQDDNYEIEPVGLNDLGILTIERRTPVIEFTSIEKTYGEADFALNAATPSGLKLSYNFVGDGKENEFTGVNQDRFSIGTAGVFTVRATVAGSSNYNSASVDALVTIKKAILTVTLLDETKIYGTPNPELSDNIEYDGFVNGEGPEVIDVAPKVSTGVTQTTNVGVYSIYFSYKGMDDNYHFEIPQIDAPFAVTQAIPSLSVEYIRKTYGDADFNLDAAAGVSTNSDGNVVYSVTSIQGDNSIRLSGLNNKIVSIKGAGEVTIKATVEGTQNYISVSEEIVLSIEKAILYAKTLNASKIYLEDNPSFEIVYTGFVNGDTQADIDELPTAFTNLTKESNVGSDYIFIRGGQDKNYEILSVVFRELGELTIEKRTPTIDFKSIVKTYGDNDFSLGATTVDQNLKISYTILGDAKENKLIGANEDQFSIGTAGAYTVRANIAKTTNYNSASVDAVVTIDKAMLTATLLGETKVYGTNNPSLEDNIEYTGFKNGDTKEDIDIAPELDTKVTQNTNVGDNYSIYVLNNGFDDNYTITFPKISAPFTVTQATPFINFQNVVKIYGEADFDIELAAAVATNSDGDVIYSIDTQPAGNGTSLYGLHNKRVSIGNAGNVYIKAAVEATTNYKELTEIIVLTIKRSKVQIRIDDVTKIYGTADPDFTYELVSGTENENQKIIVKRDTNDINKLFENVGKYPIYPGNDNLNYEIEVLNEAQPTLTIFKAPVSVSTQANPKVYGQDDPKLRVALHSGNIAPWDVLEATREAKQDVGEYPIEVTLDALNYDITYLKKGFLKITPAPITITVTPNKKAYRAKDPALEVKVLNGQLYYGDKLKGQFVRAAGEAVKKYAVTSNFEEMNPNYDFQFEDLNFDIVPETIVIAIDHIKKGFGEEDPKFTYKIESGNLGAIDIEQFEKSLVREAGEQLGSYVISSDFESNNYDLTIHFGMLEVKSIAPKVSTEGVKNIIDENATVFGSIEGNGGAEITEIGFLVSSSGATEINYENTSNVDLYKVNSETEDFFSTVETLESATTYYYRAYAKNEIGIGYGEIKTFISKDTEAPQEPNIMSVVDSYAQCSTEDSRLSSQNTFVIQGTTEPLAVVEVFINKTSVGYTYSGFEGNWTLDLSNDIYPDGVYAITATATDLSNNTSGQSQDFIITIHTADEDNDGIPDSCDADSDNDGFVDATQVETKKGYGISPNGDGINDVLNMRGIEKYPNSNLQVFSRSGRLVFKAKGYDNTWDGHNMFTSGRARLPEGSYFFVLDFNGDGKTRIQGWIYITY